MSLVFKYNHIYTIFEFTVILVHGNILRPIIKCKFKRTKFFGPVLEFFSLQNYIIKVCPKIFQSTKIEVKTEGPEKEIFHNHVENRRHLK